MERGRRPCPPRASASRPARPAGAADGTARRGAHRARRGRTGWPSRCARRAACSARWRWPGCRWAPVRAPAAAEALQDLARHAGVGRRATCSTHEETRRLSVTDALTGAGNFRHLSTTLAREVERATRFSRPLSVVMLDLDHFKGVNDSHGHAFGDGVLREFARRLQDCLREVDTVARYGGEEFAVVLPETGVRRRRRRTARIVAAVQRKPFTVGRPASPDGHRVGRGSVVPRPRADRERDPARGDAALYVAKARRAGPLVPRRGRPPRAGADAGGAARARRGPSRRTARPFRIASPGWAARGRRVATAARGTWEGKRDGPAGGRLRRNAAVDRRRRGDAARPGR